MEATKVKCLPVYIIIDTSGSMNPFEQILNDAIENLYDVLITRPAISEFAHISIISFNNDAEVVLQMTSLQALDSLPVLSTGGVTNFESVVALLQERIYADLPALNSSGLAVLRPVAFLLTDGQPTDSEGRLSSAWKASFAALTDKSNRRHPNVVPFGYGAATPDTIRQFGTLPGAAFIAEHDSTAEALSNVIPGLLNTLAASADNGALVIPREIDGFITVSEEIDF